MNVVSIKKRLLKNRTAKIGITGNSLCVRIPLRDLETAGMELGESVVIVAKAGKITLRKLLPRELMIMKGE